MSYSLNIPIYKYNTGRADNGNTIISRFYDNKENAIIDREFLNKIFNRDKKWDGYQYVSEISEEETNKINEIIDWEGYQIKDAYITTEIRV
jgi:hypothetical protein